MTILAATAALVALTVFSARMALHRPALGRADTVWDGFLRASGADRFLGVGAGGIFAATAAAASLVNSSVITAALILAAALSTFWPGPTAPRTADPDTAPETAPGTGEESPAPGPQLTPDVRS